VLQKKRKRNALKTKTLFITVVGHQAFHGGPNRTKRQRKGEFAFSELGHISSPTPRHCAHSDLEKVTPLAFLVLQLADGRLSDFSASIIE
jgi:hypothetical protein